MVKLYKYFFAFILVHTVLSGIEGYGQYNKAYLINQSRYLLSNDQFTEAISVLNQLVKIDSTQDEAWFLRGIAKYYLNDLHGARLDFNKSIKFNPVSSQSYLYRAIVLSRLSRYSSAITDYDMAIDLRPSFGLAYFNRGIAYLLIMKPKNAINDFSQTIKLEPRNVDAFINRGIAKTMDFDTLGALTDFRQAILLKPFYSEPYSRRGKLYFELGDFHLALSDFNKAIEYDSTGSINYFYRSLVYSQLKKPLDALNDLNRTISLNPDNALSLYNRGLVHWQIGRTSDALADFDKVAELNPDNILIYYNRGVLLYELKKYSDAVKDFTLAISLYSDFANAYLGRSAAYSMLGKNIESHKDHLFAQSIAERFKDNHSQPWTDTTKKFNELIAFNSDFDPKTRIPNLENLNVHSIDIKSFARFALVPKANVKSTYPSTEWLDYINNQLNETPYQLTLCIDFETRNIDENALLPDSSFLFKLNQGNELSLQEKYREAVDHYAKMLIDFPLNPIILLNLSVAQADMTNFIASFEKEMASISFNQTPRKQTKTAEGNIKEYSFNESFETINYLESTSNHSFAIDYNKGNIYALSGDMESAVESYTKTIQQNPDFIEAWYNRGLIYLMIRDTEKGCIDLSIAGEKGIKQAYLLINRFCRPQ